jgi:hypothetical protein
LTELYETFERLRRRHLRLGQVKRRRAAGAYVRIAPNTGKVATATARRRAGYHAAWSRWSQSYDEVTAAADRLIRPQPKSLADLVMMFRALEWVLLADATIVDKEAERQLRAFGRNLRRFAAAE